MVDVREAAHPILAAEVESAVVADLKVIDDRAFVACDEGIRILDVSDPRNPFTIGLYSTDGQARAVSVLGHYGYVCVPGGLEVISLEDPTHPVRVGFVAASMPVDVAILDRYAVLLDIFQGLIAVDVTNPSAPEVVGLNRKVQHGNRLVVSDGLIYVAGLEGLSILRIAPRLTTIVRTGNTIALEWTSIGTVLLQRSTSLSSPQWEDLLGSEFMQGVDLPLWSGSEFFRLVAVNP